MKITKKQHILHLLVLAGFFLYEQTYCSILPDIVWDPAYPIYNQNQCGSLSTVLHVREGDVLNIICANRDLNQGITSPNMVNNRDFYYNIHVTENEDLFTNKTIGSNSTTNIQKATTLHNCSEKFFNKGLKTSVEKYKIVFSSWSVIRGRKFLPGKTYYFFTTADGSKESLGNSVAPNKTRKMGFQVYICKPNEKCQYRNRMNRCLDVPTPEKRYQPSPRQHDNGNEVSFSKEAIVGIALVLFVFGIAAGTGLTRLYQAKQSKNENIPVGKDEMSQFLKAQSTLTEKSDLDTPSMKDLRLSVGKSSFDV